jgi:hypothetical protein
MIYLDHNATTPLRTEVFAAMQPFLTECWGMFKRQQPDPHLPTSRDTPP